MTSRSFAKWGTKISWPTKVSWGENTDMLHAHAERLPHRNVMNRWVEIHRKTGPVNYE